MNALARLRWLVPGALAVLSLGLMLTGACATSSYDPPPKAPAMQTPAAVAERFYALHQPDASAGLPDGARLAALAPLLTRRLRERIDAAHAVQQAFIAAHPDEKPPWIEGALFVSLFEGYTSAKVITIAVEGDGASVPVRFAYVAGSERTEWTDTVKLRREDGAWRIDDVVYGGQWDFANHGRLSTALDARE